MYPREFEYVAAGSVDEAARLLEDNPGAKVMSGGMSLIPMMKLRLLSPELVGAGAASTAGAPGSVAICSAGTPRGFIWE